MRDRSWTHEAYDRPMRLRILHHKLTALVTRDSRPLSLVEERLIHSAAVLIVSLWEYEREFATAQPAVPISRNYLPTLKELKQVLNQLGLPENGKKPHGKEKDDFDLASLLAAS